MGVPEVHKGVVHLPGRVPTHPDVRVAPSGSVKRSDVVAAEKGDLAVHAHHVAVEPENVPWVQDLRRTRQRAEVEAMNLFRKPFERERHENVGKPVEDHVYLNALLGLAREGIDEAASDLVALPDKGSNEDLMLCGLDLL